jgi:Domain of unknown function (DUF4337)
MSDEDNSKHFEILCGVVIAFFAAVLAITDLGAGKFGDDELIAHNEKNNAYFWYQSKGIKETMVEGQRDTLKALLTAGSIQPEQLATVNTLVASLDKKLARYAKDKQEILVGSKAVGQANWSQEVDGKMGQVIGGKEWETQAALLGAAGDYFDYATLFLQIALVIGAISLVVQGAGLRRAFFLAMIILGGIGSVFSVISFMKAFAI